MEDLERACEVLEKLRSLGVRVAIDDFGTGYSSLAYLQRFPVDVLKIDRSFVDGLGPERDESAIVSTMLGLARALGLDCVAEGVETPDQLDRLVDLGCRRAQGFLWSEARPADEVAEMIAAGVAPGGDAPSDRPPRR